MKHGNKVEIEELNKKVKKKDKEIGNKFVSNKRKHLNLSYNFFIGAVIAAIVIIVVVNTTFIFFVCFPEVKEKIFGTESSVATNLTITHEYDSTQKRASKYTEVDKSITEMTGAEKVESALLSSGIAIISIAIAVWAGLNIIKSLEKNNYKQLSEEVEKNNNERKRFAISTLLNNIEGLDDELNRYLYKSLNDIEFSYQLIDAELFSQINTVETWFQGLYKKHYQGGKIVPDNYISALETVNELLPRTKDLPKQIQHKIKLYLNIRCAEIHFYLGFRGSAKDIYDHMTTAIEKYCESFPLMKQPNCIDINMPPFTNDIILNTYLLNTIGQAHSEIVFKCKNVLSLEEFSEYKNKTTTYFKLMIVSLNTHCGISVMQRELYYRDYGCALERVDGITEETINTIADVYECAINAFLASDETNKKKNNVFKVYFSLFHKYCESVFVNEQKELKNLNCFKPDVSLKDYNKINKIKGYTTKRKAYIEMAITEYAQSLEFIKHKAFYYRDVAVIGYVDNNIWLFRQARASMKEVKEQLEAIINEKYYDPFMKEIIYQYNQLCEY